MRLPSFEARCRSPTARASPRRRSRPAYPGRREPETSPEHEPSARAPPELDAGSSRNHTSLPQARSATTRRRRPVPGQRVLDQRRCTLGRPRPSTGGSRKAKAWASPGRVTRGRRSPRAPASRSRSLAPRPPHPPSRGRSGSRGAPAARRGTPRPQVAQRLGEGAEDGARRRHGRLEARHAARHPGGVGRACAGGGGGAARGSGAARAGDAAHRGAPAGRG